MTRLATLTAALLVVAYGSKGDSISGRLLQGVRIGIGAGATR